VNIHTKIPFPSKPEDGYSKEPFWKPIQHDPWFKDFCIFGCPMLPFASSGNSRQFQDRMLEKYCICGILN
jgi:hypothetical protein